MWYPSLSLHGKDVRLLSVVAAHGYRSGHIAMLSKSASATLFVILILSLSGCSQLYTFEGIVVDGDGQPISGAAIMLYPHNWERPSRIGNNGTSGDDGTFVATWCCAVGVDFFRMAVSMDGYREQDPLVKADEKNLRIVLERLPGEREVGTRAD